MTDEAQTLWETRTLPDDITLELRAGDEPALVLVQGKRTPSPRPLPCRR